MSLRSKVKDSEWWNFGVEWLLGAANGDEAGRRIQEIASRSYPPSFVMQWALKGIRIVVGGLARSWF
jgi:hypothetical protein